MAAPARLGRATHPLARLDSANAALTVIEHRKGLPPNLVMFNEMSHLPPDLRWTGLRASQALRRLPLH